MARRKFCSFIYSQCGIGEGSIMRKNFCEELMRLYKHVDCPGRILHNMDAPELAIRENAAQWNASKIEFLSKYKFNIAFENSSTPGYITEKLMDAYLANTVPIYFGSAGNISPFPKESIIYVNDYDDFDSLIAKIKEIDNNDEAYMRMLAANPLRNNMQIKANETFEAFLRPILEKKRATFEKDPLMVSDAHRLIRLGGKSPLGIRFRMFLLAMKAIYAQFISRAPAHRRALGMAYWQLKYALDDAKELSRI